MTYLIIKNNLLIDNKIITYTESKYENSDLIDQQN